MLDEFLHFNDLKMPDPNTILKPKREDKYKPPIQNQIQKQKKPSLGSVESTEEFNELKKLEEETLKLIKEQEALSLAEQVLRRQQEEQDIKRKEILKQLHKTKHMDLNKFLTRAVG